MPFQYKMIQIPPNISVRGVEQGQEAAQYLENVVNGQAGQGWDFYRVDTIGVEVSPGCLMSLLGRSSEYNNYYVVSFRKETQSPT